MTEIDCKNRATVVKIQNLKNQIIRKDNPFDGSVLRLRRCLEAIREVRGRVLDIGCGGGVLTKSLKFYRPDLQIWGIDINKAAIKKASFKPTGVKFMVGDAMAMPFKKDAFDVGFMFDVLEHVGNPAVVLREVARVLRRGGIFHFSVPVERSLFTLDGWFKKLLGVKLRETKSGHVNQFNLSDLKVLLSRNGFRIKDVTYREHFFHQMVGGLYLIYLHLFNKSVGELGQDYQSWSDFPKALTGLFLKSSSFVSNLESTILIRFPGLNIQITAIKK